MRKVFFTPLRWYIIKTGDLYMESVNQNSRINMRVSKRIIYYYYSLVTLIEIRVLFITLLNCARYFLRVAVYFNLWINIGLFFVLLIFNTIFNFLFSPSTFSLFFDDNDAEEICLENSLYFCTLFIHCKTLFIFGSTVLLYLKNCFRVLKSKQ